MNRFRTAPVAVLLSLLLVLAIVGGRRLILRAAERDRTDETVNNYRYTNHLIHETSPYLLQHAHNPVDWYPWGEEALEKARKENKPILLSIGYSACHWCHVMERESFETKTSPN